MGKHPTTFNKLTYNIIRYWFDLQEYGDFTWRVSDCEELVGVLTGDDGVGFS